VVATCIDIMRQATEEHHGTVIKTMGDEVMSTFPTADDALNAAAQMQKQIVLHPQLKVDEQTVAIRIGCNFGPVVLENRDIFGSAVHTANRMTSQAKAGQIITTATMVERLSSDWRATVRQIDIATLKGRSSEVALFEVLWQTEDITSMVPGIATEPRAGHTMRLVRDLLTGSVPPDAAAAVKALEEEGPGGLPGSLERPRGASGESNDGSGFRLRSNSLPKNWTGARAPQAGPGRQEVPWWSCISSSQRWIRLSPTAGHAAGLRGLWQIGTRDRPAHITPLDRSFAIAAWS
jgi:hypothetical protein